MKNRILVPQYNLEAATEASTLLRTASEEVNKLLTSFGSEYRPMASANNTALNMLARFTPDLIARGVGLDCMLSISDRGKIKIDAYQDNPEDEWVGYTTLFEEDNLGPFKSSDKKDHALGTYDCVSKLFRTIESRLGDDPRAIDSGKPCLTKYGDRECCPGSLNRAKEALAHFDKYLREGNQLLVEPFSYYNH